MPFMFKNKGVLAVLLILCIALSACVQENAEKPTSSQAIALTPEKPNYSTQEVKLADFLISLDKSASIVLPKQTNVAWENGHGIFMESLVRSGDVVKKGDVLMRFEVTADNVAMEELQLQLKRTLEAYKDNKALKETAIENAKKAAVGLTAHELILAEQNIEKLQVDYERYVYQTEKTIQGIRKSINDIEEHVAENTLIAPHDGIVKDVTKLREGDDVYGGAVLVSLYALDSVYLRTDDLGYQLRYGMDVEITVTVQEHTKTLQSRVVSTPNMLPAELRGRYTFLNIDLTNLSEEEFEGFINAFSRVNIRYNCTSVAIKDVIVIRSKAIYKGADGDYVYIFEDGIAKKRYVQVGMESDGYAWIIDGLSEGQTLILD